MNSLPQPSDNGIEHWPEDLTASEVEEARSLLYEPIEFMDSTDFVDEAKLKAVWKAARKIRRPKTDWYKPLQADRPDPRQLQSVEVVALLTPEQERHLFLCFNDARRRAESARRSIRPKRIAITKVRTMLHWHQEAQRLREMIAEYNLGLVLAMLRRFRNSGIDFADLISEGHMALMRAIDKFRVDRGFKFSSYACRCIRAALGNAAKKETNYRYRFNGNLEAGLSEPDGVDLRAEELEEDCLHELERIVETNSAELSNLERQVIRLRFFEKSDKDRRLTLAEVGKLVGYTKERVRQIQLAALEKLRHTLEVEFLDGPRTNAALN